MFEVSKENLKIVPKKPGVYLFKDSTESIIYIGKAKDLKNRINQYFSSKHEFSIKTRFLVKNISYFEYIILDNEIEALLLENKLIKKNKPKYNINLKDSKTFPYIKITDEKLPKILFTRIVTNKGTYFGPFTNGEIRREIFNLVSRIFKLITKNTYTSKSTINYEIGLAPAKDLKSIDVEEYSLRVEEAKEFLRGDVNKIKAKLKLEMKQASKEMKYEIASEKKKQIEAIEHLKERQKVDLMKNYDEDVIVKLENEIKTKSMIVVLKIKKGVISSKKEYKFGYCDDDLILEFLKMYYSQNSVPKEILLEKEIFEDKSNGTNGNGEETKENSEDQKRILEEYLNKLKKGKVKIIVPKRGEKLSLVNMALKNAKQNFDDNDVLLELKEKLKLPKIPRIIECFDMSNLGSEHLVGGMVVFLNGEAFKGGYRRFEIKSFSGRNDDFASMKEVIFRRYKRIRDEGGEIADLIVVDGGKGQLRSGVEALRDLGLKIPIISLAKRDEEIFVLGQKDSLKFDKNSKMMLFLRNVRDSTHNYVISYNRKKREMKMKDDFKEI